MVKIGVLALQGDFREHIRMLTRCGVEAFEIKKADMLHDIDGLIIPGGESTTIGKLMERYGFIQAITDFHETGHPIYGTCAGMIIIAKSIVDGHQPLLGLMDIKVRRNAFGRQIDSCESELHIKEIGDKPFRAIFIRAPWIESVGSSVEVMAYLDGHPVMAREGTLLAGAFHPELTADVRIHEYFINMVQESGQAVK